MQATVVITTKDRRDDLHGAITSALAQSVPVEVLVIDDGSGDGTSEMVRKEFPAVRLVRHTESRGLIVRRNEGARLALAPVVFSIDDDAAFQSRDTVKQTLQEFDHPRVGAVAVPFVNINQDTMVRQRAQDTGRVWVTDRYIGTAHAIRRDLFLSLGGYREHFVHQGEEGDYCLRMLARGNVVRLGTADPIHHFESPRRSFERMDYYGRRNDILFAWHNIPLPDLLWHLPATTVSGLMTAVRCGRYRHMLAGLAKGYLDSMSMASRCPISKKIYGLFRLLKSEGPILLIEAESILPPDFE